MDVDVLDNPIWFGLNTGNKEFAFGNEQVKFLNRQMGAFAGMPSHEESNWSALYEGLKPGNIAVMFSTEKLEVPGGFSVNLEKDLLQMIHSGEMNEEHHDSIVSLQEEHIPEMLSLTALTKPGPFFSRTIDFGNYEGIFDGERLVSMAGQRFQPGDFVEVSAVCTHPSALGKGYAGILLRSQVNKIRSASRVPFLHVYPDNYGAVALYKKCGFEERRMMMVYVLEKK
jgi:ribosomal protein S18 acetylase RimI-like enzyme